jgi:hypothetical protein
MVGLKGTFEVTWEEIGEALDILKEYEEWSKLVETDQWACKYKLGKAKTGKACKKPSCQTFTCILQDSQSRH